ncbi:hypothetical protein G6F57_015511 [Rhizopus arrhizus]|nr:hypothetical protein G6F57_015511 [Rhizopus arrhizus]
MGNGCDPEIIAGNVGGIAVEGLDVDPDGIAIGIGRGRPGKGPLRMPGDLCIESGGTWYQPVGAAQTRDHPHRRGLRPGLCRQQRSGDHKKRNQQCTHANLLDPRFQPLVHQAQ